MDYIKSKLIKGYEDYIIFTTGKVYSTKSNKFIKHETGTYKYYLIFLYKNKKRKSFRLHRLLGLHFIPNPNNLPTIDHIDKNKLNNNLSNLRWASYTKQSINRNIKITNTTGYTGVFIENNKYRTRWYINKKPYTKSFSIKKYGDEKAKQLAIEYRKEMEEKHYKNLI